MTGGFQVMTDTQRPAETSSATARKDAIVLLGGLPVVGSFFKAVGGVSDRTRDRILGLVMIFVIYPPIAVAAALLLVRWSPERVKDHAREFILTSIGVEQRAQQILEDSNNRIDLTNAVIDASIPLVFAMTGDERYYQKVAPNQRISFDASIKPISLNKADPSCVVASLDSDDKIGELVVSTAASSHQFRKPIFGALDQLRPIGRIDEAEWKRFAEATTEGETPAAYQLKVSFIPNAQLAVTHGFFNCFTVDTIVNMNLFKPRASQKPL